MVKTETKNKLICKTLMNHFFSPGGTFIYTVMSWKACTVLVEAVSAVHSLSRIIIISFAVTGKGHSKGPDVIEQSSGFLANQSKGRKPDDSYLVLVYIPFAL